MILCRLCTGCTVPTIARCTKARQIVGIPRRFWQKELQIQPFSSREGERGRDRFLPCLLMRVAARIKRTRELDEWVLKALVREGRADRPDTHSDCAVIERRSFHQMQNGRLDPASSPIHRQQEQSILTIHIGIVFLCPVREHLKMCRQDGRRRICAVTRTALHNPGCRGERLF